MWRKSCRSTAVPRDAEASFRRSRPGAPNARASPTQLPPRPEAAHPPLRRRLLHDLEVHLVEEPILPARGQARRSRRLPGLPEVQKTLLLRYDFEGPPPRNPGVDEDEGFAAER